MCSIVPISDLTPQQCKTIKDELTIVEKRSGYQVRNGFKPKIVKFYVTDAKNKVVYLPYIFAKALTRKNYNLLDTHVSLRDSLKALSKEELKNTEFAVKLRSDQLECVTSSQEYLGKFSTVTIGLPPGSGKTIISSYLSWACDYVTLVLVHRTALIKQWVNTFNKSMPFLAQHLWVVGTQKEDLQQIPPIIICMNSRIDNIDSKILKAVGTLIIDEAHTFCTPSNVSCMFATQPRFIILATATLQRSDGMELMAQNLAGKHGIFKTSDIAYDFYLVRTSISLKDDSTNDDNFMAVCNKLCEIEERTKLILDIIEQNLHRKFIVLSRLEPYVGELCAKLVERKIEADSLSGKKDTYNDSKVLVGTVSKIGTGFDEENACEDFKGMKSDTLILVHSVSAWQLFEQMRGRVMRASTTPAVVWLCESDCATERHFKKLRKYIEETKGRIIEIDVTKDSLYFLKDTDED
jgi:hypothetical protein